MKSTEISRKFKKKLIKYQKITGTKKIIFPYVKKNKKSKFKKNKKWKKMW